MFGFEPFVAEIGIFGFNFAPKNWAQCNGQLLPITQNTALFSLLGTFYGGDGKSTFALPNLQGCSPMSTGWGSGLTERFLGEMSGSESITLLDTELPPHSHSLQATLKTGDPAGAKTASAIGAYPTAGTGDPLLYTLSQSGSFMTPLNIDVNERTDVSGSSLPHNNMMPYLTVNFCIAMVGVFPPRP